MNKFDKSEIKSDLVLIFYSLIITIAFYFPYFLVITTVCNWTLKESLIYLIPLFVLTGAPVAGITLTLFGRHDIVRILSQYKFIVAIPRGEENEK